MRAWTIGAMTAAGCVAGGALLGACYGSAEVCANDFCTPAPDGSADGTPSDTSANDGAIVDGRIPDAADSAVADTSLDSSVDSADGYTNPCAGHDLTQPPSSGDACVITDDLAIYVAPSGSDASGLGTQASPVASIAKGLALAFTAHKRVYVCASATYAEHLALTTTNVSPSGVGIYGGLACGTGGDGGIAWSYSGTKAVVAPSTKGYALSVDTVSATITLEDLELDAQAATVADESSVGAFANAATSLVLRHVTIKAGSGFAGAAGATGTSNYDVSLTNDNALIAGHDAVNATGGPQQDCTNLCVNGVHATGGAGGNGGNGVTTSPTAGLKGLPDLGAGAGGQGVCSSGGVGQNGGPAAAASGGVAATIYGALTAAGWSNTSGLGGNGMTGGAGQGGGGGSGEVSATKGGGAGGGCGGCGGVGATGGHAGGSSFALVTIASTVTLDACDLHAGDAKPGGKGGDGQAGQVGGITGANAVSGCPAGSGGQGGQGGGGAGGAGGLSVGIAYNGAAPTQKNGTTAAPGNPGAGGAAGAGGAPAAQKGKDGVAAATMQL